MLVGVDLGKAVEDMDDVEIVMVDEELVLDKRFEVVVEPNNVE